MKKILSALFDKLEKLPGKNLPPGFCCLGVTDACMLRCKMCEKWKDDIYVKDPQAAPSLEQWKQCVTDLARMVEFPFELDIGGGEAFMFEGILDLVRCGVDKGFTVSVATNGFLVDEAMAKRIAASGLQLISISMDSLKEEVHDYLRGTAGAYRKAMDAIAYLHRHCKGMRIHLCCVLYEYNQETVLELAEWADKNEMIASINFMAAMQPNNTPAQRNWWEGAYGDIWPKKRHRTIEILQKAIDLKKKGCKIGNPVSQLMAFQAYYRDPNTFVKRKQCNLGRSVLVSAVGDIYLCYEFEKIGSIKKDRLADVWYSAKAHKVRDSIAACKKNCHHLINCFDEFHNDFP
ncbi:MAG TPA: radical SAM protein [Patescibacteria group bacterium]|nr:radical SAM protein [Patescibacteria group bacterium]